MARARCRSSVGARRPALHCRRARHPQGLCRAHVQGEGLHPETLQRDRGLLVNAEREYYKTGKFEFVNTDGYYHSLPGDPLRKFIETMSEVQPRWASRTRRITRRLRLRSSRSTYSYTEILAAADTIQPYNLICRQVAALNGMTASVLPNPVVSVDGSGMHTNISVSQNGKDLFWRARRTSASSPGTSWTASSPTPTTSA